jgi:hypothetical protein
VNGPFRKRASTTRPALIFVRQVPVPEHGPNQPRNECPLFGLAVRVTVTPSLNFAEHPVAATTPRVMVQLIPDGLEVTTPSPVPLPVIRSVRFTATTAASCSVGWGVSWQACSRASAREAVSRRAIPERGRGRRMATSGTAGGSKT